MLAAHEGGVEVEACGAEGEEVGIHRGRSEEPPVGVFVAGDFGEVEREGDLGAGPAELEAAVPEHLVRLVFAGHGAVEQVRATQRDGGGDQLGAEAALACEGGAWRAEGAAGQRLKRGSQCGRFVARGRDAVAGDGAEGCGLEGERIDGLALSRDECSVGGGEKRLGRGCRLKLAGCFDLGGAALPGDGVEAGAGPLFEFVGAREPLALRLGVEERPEREVRFVDLRLAATAGCCREQRTEKGADGSVSPAQGGAPEGRRSPCCRGGL